MDKMDKIEKRYLNLLATEFDKQDCDYCNYSDLCLQYQKETGRKHLCNVIFTANDIINKEI